MAIFVIFRVIEADKVGAAIAREFPEDNYQLQGDEWLVSADLTPKEISDRLGISEGENGGAIIFSMRGYYGRTQTDIWDWIKAKAEGSK